MRKVWVGADSIVSPLGFTTRDNFKNVSEGISGIKPTTISGLSTDSIYAGKIDDLKKRDGLTAFDTLCSLALENLLTLNPITGRALLILSTTKGNIELLEPNSDFPPHVHLHSTAAFLSEKFNFSDHLVVSNACISGVLAIIIAKRYIEIGKFDNVVVLGADILTGFVVSGFKSLMALSDEPCKPFDCHRKGINLGEGAGAILLTSTPDACSTRPEVYVTGTGLSNDANHISGPSRTGEELSMAIKHALLSGDLDAGDIDFISAHGTATVFNDEMEAKAFALAGMDNVPVNSLKGYYGHTLGAAGVIETIISVHALQSDLVIRTMGFESQGVSTRLNVCNRTETKTLKRILKTASGFGGCNAALILEK